MDRSPHVAQIAFCSSDITRTTRRYTDVFGFASAGGKVLWGPRVAGIQGLGADTEFILWWLVDRQDFLQLEVFSHSSPAQRPRPETATAADLGWGRWGFAVPDLDAAYERLTATGVSPWTAITELGGIRRFAFRDPELGIDVEVLEEAGLPGGTRLRHHDLAPTTLYAALSVRDLDSARRFLITGLGLQERPLELLHPTGADTLWGLEGAERSGFLAAAGDRFLEVTSYTRPTPRPLPEDHRASDQGIMNAAVGFRSRAEVTAARDALVAAGFTPNAPISPAGATYVPDGQGNTVEIIGVEPERDVAMGFTPQ